VCPQAVLSHDSPLIGKTLSDPSFALLYDATPAGLRISSRDKLSWTPLDERDGAHAVRPSVARFVVLYVRRSVLVLPVDIVVVGDEENPAESSCLVPDVPDPCIPPRGSPIMAGLEDGDHVRTTC
jgi:hypothetical protein